MIWFFNMTSIKEEVSPIFAAISNGLNCKEVFENLLMLNKQRLYWMTGLLSGRG